MPPREEEREGGTEVWCPKCQCETICKAVNPSEVGSQSNKQRAVHKKYPDIHVFRRGRICQKCGHGFMTVELPADFVVELAKLRDMLGKSNKLST
jgi:hypothetical protein